MSVNDAEYHYFSNGHPVQAEAVRRGFRRHAWPNQQAVWVVQVQRQVTSQVAVQFVDAPGASDVTVHVGPVSRAPISRPGKSEHSRTRNPRTESRKSSCSALNIELGSCIT